MKKIVIFGNLQFSILLKAYIEQFTRDTVVAFTVHNQYITTDTLESLPVVPAEDIEKYYPPSDYYILPSMGYKKMNSIKQKIVSEFALKGYRFYSFIHPSSQLYCDNIGKGNIIFEGVVAQKFSSIGDFNIIFSHVSISHHCKIENYIHLAPNVALGGNVIIHDNCFLGIQSTVKNDVIVDNFTLIGAGAYVNKNTKRGSVVVPQRSMVLENKSSIDFI